MHLLSLPSPVLPMPSSTNLRSAASRFLGRASSTDPADACIVIHGMGLEASPEDLTIISKTIVSAYNHAYEAAGYTIESQSTASAPQTVDLAPDCLSPPDDDANALQEAADLGKLHRKFEQKLCTDLRAQGSANLANVRDCSFSFLDMPGQSDQNMSIQAVESFRSGQKAKAQVMVHGTRHLFSEKDLELIDQSIAEAYNQNFSSIAGFSLSSFESVADLDFPFCPDYRHCPPDDDAVMTSDARMVAARVSPVGWMHDCRLCPPDGDVSTLASAAAVKGSVAPSL
jgi:hypothetical protein